MRPEERKQNGSWKETVNEVLSRHIFVDGRHQTMGECRLNARAQKAAGGLCGGGGKI